MMYMIVQTLPQHQERVHQEVQVRTSGKLCGVLLSHFMYNNYNIICHIMLIFPKMVYLMLYIYAGSPIVLSGLGRKELTTANQGKNFKKQFEDKLLI